MTSILTNTSSMVALQTLRGINSNLESVQNEISTGKSISSAKDNSAVWAISKVMESDVSGFEAISESLALGESTVAVAQNAAETVTDLLTEMKGRIIAAQEENVDREKIQTDIDALTDQIQSVVSAAQFNGMNLIDGTSTEDVTILSSLDRDSSGNVTSSTIDVARQSLSTTTPSSSQVFGAAGGTATDITGTPTAVTTNADPLTGTANFNTGTSQTVTIAQVAEGTGYKISLGDININTADGGTATGDRAFEYVASATDGTADVADALASQINAFLGAATDAGAYSVSVADNVITINNDSGTNAEIGLGTTAGGTPGSAAASGGLGALANIDVTNTTDAAAALSTIETLINTSIDAAAAFGSAAGRIETQSDFVSKLSDSLKTGIGAMVDADMEEASARLQALQVQQQLGIQALSIANSAPQTVMSLFG